MNEQARLRELLRLLIATFPKGQYGTESEILEAYLVAVEGATLASVELAVRDVLQDRVSSESGLDGRTLPSAPALARVVREHLYDLSESDVGFSTPRRSSPAAPAAGPAAAPSAAPGEIDFSVASEFPKPQAEGVVPLRFIDRASSGGSKL